MRYGLIGKNIQYSKSPKIHEFMAKKLNIDLRYDLFDIDESDIPHLFKHLRNNVFKGFNVTIPFKQIMMKHVDVLTSKAKRIKAVNTIYLKDGKIVGDNTDYDGFLGLIKMSKINVENQKIFILGTGGAAKAAYVVLTDLGADVTVVTRNTNNIDPMFNKVVTYNKLFSDQVDIYVQATPIGTYPKVTESVLNQSLVAGKTVIELIYNPPITQIMKYASKSYGGVNMLILQALKSEEIWFNQKISISNQLIEELKEVIYSE
jgi:shikimate dehydrogenase